jgi:hypothetical protein
MFKFNSTTFYQRHQRELSKYIFEHSKVLHIIADDVDKTNLPNNCEYLFINKNEEIDELIKSVNQKFDLIILTDLLESADDINKLFSEISSIIDKNGKLLITSINNLWYPITNLFELLKVKKVSQKKVYTALKKINNILPKNRFSLISYNTRQFLPFRIFGVGTFINSLLETLLSKFNLGIKTYILYQNKSNEYTSLSKSIIIPAKNEEKNLKPLLDRIPKFQEVELIIACGISEDNTLEMAHHLKKTSEFDIKVIEQSGKGKANAVFEALSLTKNDIIAILDSDISVDPETLTDFFRIIEQGEADFVNGTRFVYRMEKESMRFINLIGNKIFQFLISIVISRKLTDSLCGTKVFHKNLKSKLTAWQKYNIKPDPFGDFDLLFTASFCGLSIAELPIHYRSRVYGKTQISRFRDGFKLISYFIFSVINFNSSVNRDFKNY